MSKHFLHFVLFAVMGGSLCSAQTSETAGDAARAQSQAPTVRIGAGDQIDMTVFNVPEMTQRQRVDENGDYSVPLVGAVHVAGLSVQQAQTLIASKFSEQNFVRGASVSLFISDFATQGVSIVGEVMKPGVYPVWGERHLLDVIAEAGGVTERANTVATVTHHDAAEPPQSFAFAKGNPHDLNSNPVVMPGDTISIGRNGVVYVLGEVGKPGGFPLDNRNGLSLLQAIALAEGTTHTAKVGAARLIRKDGQNRTEIAINLKQVVKGRADDVPLKDDDIIYVPNSSIKTIADRTLPQVVSAASTATIYTQLR